MPYPHGIKVNEAASVEEIQVLNAGVHVVVGAAPVNLTANPTAQVNKPVLVKSLAEAKELFGYSNDFASYGISEAMYVYFEVAKVSPVVFINVLDPTTHKTAITKTVSLTNKQGTITDKGVLLDSLTVVHNETTLAKGTDYIASFTVDGEVLISVLNDEVTGSVTVTGDKINPSAITDADVVGAVNASTGVKTGIELLTEVFPRFGRYISIVTAPGFTGSTVAAALQAKTTELNGVFGCETIIDLNAANYNAVVDAKESAAIVSPHAFCVWPKVKKDNHIIDYSVFLAATAAACDKDNDDIPVISLSNKPISISGVCDAAGNEIVFDRLEANELNAQGIITAINNSGWRTWGNNTAAYPESATMKERWGGIRRFITWMENRFAVEYFSRIDSAANFRLIEQIVEDENAFCSQLVADGKCAGAYIEYKESENTADDLAAGKLKFHHHVAQFAPAESIENTFEFDMDLFKNSLLRSDEETGGEE
jgi:phage tail sheath protein FI